MKKVAEPENKTIVNVELQEALGKLREAMYAITSIWDEADGDLNDILSNGYPFKLSFDDVASRTAGWVDGIIDAMHGVNASYPAYVPVYNKHTAEEFIPNWVVDHVDYMENYCDNKCHECAWFDRCNNFKNYNGD